MARSSHSQQFRVLVEKCYTLKIRGKLGMVGECIFPFIMVLLIQILFLTSGTNVNQKLPLPEGYVTSEPKFVQIPMLFNPLLVAPDDGGVSSQMLDLFTQSIVGEFQDVLGGDTDDRIVFSEQLIDYLTDLGFLDPDTGEPVNKEVEDLLEPFQPLLDPSLPISDAESELYLGLIFSQIQRFDTETALEEEYTASNGTAVAGVVLELPTDILAGLDDIQYKIRLNSFSSPEPNQLYVGNVRAYNPAPTEIYDDLRFTALQVHMNRVVLGTQVAINGGTENEIFAAMRSFTVQLRRFPNDDLKIVTTADTIRDTLVRYAAAPIFTLGYLFMFYRLVNALTEEKETRIKDTMQIMGMYPSAYWWSWWFSTFTITFATLIFPCIVK